MKKKPGSDIEQVNKLVLTWQEMDSPVCKDRLFVPDCESAEGVQKEKERESVDVCEDDNGEIRVCQKIANKK